MGAQNTHSWQHYRQPTLRMLFERDQQSMRLRITCARESDASSGSRKASDFMVLVSQCSSFPYLSEPTRNQGGRGFARSQERHAILCYPRFTAESGVQR